MSFFGDQCCAFKDLVFLIDFKKFKGAYDLFDPPLVRLYITVFPTEAKKVRICENMYGRFAVEIQRYVKIVRQYSVIFFSLLKFLQLC